MKPPGGAPNQDVRWKFKPFKYTRRGPVKIHKHSAYPEDIRDGSSLQVSLVDRDKHSCASLVQVAKRRLVIGKCPMELSSKTARLAFGNRQERERSARIKRCQESVRLT